MRFLLISFFIILALGCIPYSDTPLTDPGSQPIDSSVLGTWFWNDEHESGYIHIGFDEDSELLRLFMLDFDRNGELEASEYSGHTSLLGGNTYLNIKWVRPEQKGITGYMVAKYNVRPDSLGIALMNFEVVEKAIQNGSIKGEVIQSGGSWPVQITESRKRLQEFILQKDKELFPEMKYLPKLKLPDKSPTGNNRVGP